MRHLFKKNALIWLLLLLPFWLPLGCGKKGPPRPPQQKQQPAVGDLVHRLEGDRVILSWSLPESGKIDGRPLSGFSVYRSRQKIPPDCPGCPVLFEKIAEIPIRQNAAGPETGRTASYSEPIEKGYRHVYKITVHWGQAGKGVDSNRVEFDY